MVKVRILTPFFAEQTSTHYLLGAEVDVPENLAERHGKNGTGFVELLKSEQPAFVKKPAKAPIKK